MLLASAQNACALVASAIPYLTAGECAAGLVGSGFNFGLVERYGEWFDNNSSVSMTHGSHICSLCRGGRLRTEPALAAVWTFETHGLPGSRRPGRKDQSAHGPILHEQCDVFLRSARRAPPPLWRAAPGWRVRANLREGTYWYPSINRRFSTVWPRLVAGLFIRKGSSFPLKGGVSN